VTCGIDKGAKQTGIACIGHGKVLFAAKIKHRSTVGRALYENVRG